MARIWAVPAAATIGQKRAGIDGIGRPATPNVATATAIANGAP